MGFRDEPEERAARHWSFDELRARISRALPEGGSLTSDLRPYSSPRQDQGETESCVAHAIVKALEIKRIVKVYGEGIDMGLSDDEALKGAHAAHVDLSRLADYYLARELMEPAETQMDDGTYISLGADVLRRYGVCTEADWPFAVDKLYMAPSWRAMRKAYVHKITAFHRLFSTGHELVDDVILSLAADNPVVYGARVGESWERYGPESDVLTLEPHPTGGHATVLVGWQPDLYGGVFIGENSWGPAWGDGGFYFISPEVIASSQTREHTVVTGGWENWASAT
jgi:C1A family cysteine protease